MDDSTIHTHDTTIRRKAFAARNGRVFRQWFKLSPCRRRFESNETICEIHSHGLCGRSCRPSKFQELYRFNLRTQILAGYDGERRIAYHQNVPFQFFAFFRQGIRFIVGYLQLSDTLLNRIYDNVLNSLSSKSQNAKLFYCAPVCLLWTKTYGLR